jgi:hypothetical protein
VSKGSTALWIAWVVGVGVLSAGLAYQLLGAEDRSLFLPGATTSGHHQIELACESCHVEAFGGGELIQEACVDCHGAELERANDTHPRSKFTDPRNADRLAKLDVRWCVTCHIEHQPDRTREMAVTVPQDVCYHCHQNIAEDRPSHEGMGFETCASAGCHNFHDNRALYEDFLLAHADEATPEQRLNPQRTPQLTASGRGEPLQAADRDAAPEHITPTILDEWARTSHAGAGVNCSDCHGAGAQWTDTPDYDVCSDCHDTETEGFLSGKHGMRLAAGLSPMTPGQARLPMKTKAADRELDCASCHGAHRFDTREAAVESCLGCHDDQHSRAFEGSPHHELWIAELAGQGAEDSGVTCATCHMPRQVHRRGGKSVTRVQHNQNDNLRPNEKMIRPVCLSCHTLAFSIDSLADPALIDNNFSSAPAKHIRSIDMAQERQ